MVLLNLPAPRLVELISVTFSLAWLFSCPSVAIDGFESDFLLLGMRGCGQNLLVLAIPDQFGVTEHIKVAIVFPKLKVVALGLESCSLVQDT